MSCNDELLCKATNSDGVFNRSEINHRFGKNDFESWVNDIIRNLSFSSVLDVCCGTGNQLVLYNSRQEVNLLVGVDLSIDSLNIARKRLLEKRKEGTEYILEDVAMEEMFKFKEIGGRNYDLISCFYGLYYANDVPGVLKTMNEHLAKEGAILIVGPYGDNNKSMFDLFKRHFELPELVTRSSGTFMKAEVLPILKENFNLEIITFVNPVTYPSVDYFMNYWKASTFYSANHEEGVLKDVQKYFDENGCLVVEKHVMACIGRKK